MAAAAASRGPERSQTLRTRTTRAMARKRDDDDGVKLASAHDLRQSFGDQCAKRMMPPALRQLMRHRSIETTMRHYTSRSAEDAADTVWTAFGANVNTFVNSQPFPTSPERNEKAASP